MRTLFAALAALVLAGCTSTSVQTDSESGGDEDVSKEEKATQPTVNIRFLYAFCNDVAEMRAFYTDLLGMQEAAFVDDEGFGWLAYKVEGLELMFFRWDENLPPEEKWAWQPGETFDAAVPMMSFSIEFPMDRYRQVVESLTEKDVTSQKPKPNWRQKSYWGWTVKDPMGNTLDLYAAPDKKPDEDDPEWPEQ